MTWPWQAVGWLLFAVLALFCLRAAAILFARVVLYSYRAWERRTPAGKAAQELRDLARDLRRQR